jgi:hypothetical protein
MNDLRSLGVVAAVLAAMGVLYLLRKLRKRTDRADQGAAAPREALSDEGEAAGGRGLSCVHLEDGTIISFARKPQSGPVVLPADIPEFLRR